MGTWSLKIRMQELELAFTDDDMQVYCRWLHHRLHSMRQELGLSCLRQVRADVNFSKNGLSDDALARLLQALQRSQLHVVCLNLYANQFTAVGARHIGDFLWEASSAVREVHLSHNRIDDEAALELIRLIADHPKYQPRRCRNNIGDWQHPLWLRLNNNWIKHPRRLLRSLESELGIPFCIARNRHSCGPTKCGWKGNSGVPLVHLYTFEVQDGPENIADQQHVQRGKPTGSSKLPRRTSPGGDTVVTHVLGSKLHSKEAVVEGSCGKPTLAALREEEDSDEEPLTSTVKDEEVLLESEVMRGEGSPMDACAEGSCGKPTLAALRE